MKDNNTDGNNVNTLCVRVPDKAISAMKPGSVWLYAFLRTYAIDTNTCYPSYKNIAKKSPFKRYQTIANYQRGLDESFVIVKKSFNGPNTYVFKKAKHYTFVDFATVKDGRLTPREFQVYVYLASCYTEAKWDGHRKIKKKRVCDDLGITRKTLSNSINKLKELGYISINSEARLWLYCTVYYSDGTTHRGKINEAEKVFPNRKSKIKVFPDCMKVFPDCFKVFLNQETKDTLQRDVLKRYVRGKGYREEEDSVRYEEYRDEEKKKEKFSPTDQAVSIHKRQYFAGDPSKFSRSKARYGINFNSHELGKYLRRYEEGQFDDDKQLNAFIEHETALWDFSVTKYPESVKGIFIAEWMEHAPTASHFMLLTKEQKAKELGNDKWTQEGVEARLGRKLTIDEVRKYTNDGKDSLDGDALLEDLGATEQEQQSSPTQEEQPKQNPTLDFRPPSEDEEEAALQEQADMYG